MVYKQKLIYESYFLLVSSKFGLSFLLLPLIGVFMKKFSSHVFKSLQRKFVSIKWTKGEKGIASVLAFPVLASLVSPAYTVS